MSPETYEKLTVTLLSHVGLLNSEIEMRDSWIRKLRESLETLQPAHDALKRHSDALTNRLRDRDAELWAAQRELKLRPPKVEGTSEKRPRGRPKGSKNKFKVVA